MTNQMHIEHENQKHFNFNHTLTGLKHSVIQSKARLANLCQHVKERNHDILTLTREFHKLADIHEVWYQNVPGYESETFRIESQIDTANHYQWGAVGGIIIAITFGVYFSAITLVAESFWILLGVSAVVAIVIGVVASVILRALLKASPVNPQAAKKIHMTMVVFGAVFFVLLAFFAWLRMQTDSPLMAYLPVIIVGIELSAIIFAGASDCGYRFYRWSEVLHEKHRHLLNQKTHLEDQITHEEETLAELEERLYQHEHSVHHPHHASHSENDHEHLKTGDNHHHHNGKDSVKHEVKHYENNLHNQPGVA